MKILLVNDDGFLAPGIIEAEEILKQYGEVYVVAPHKSMSGMGTAVTVGKTIQAKQIDDHHFVTNGTPSDCAEYGILMLDVDFDVVVAGVNNGLNIAGDTLHSGTIGACLEALSYHIPAIALSHNKNIKVAKENLNKVMDFILKNDLLNEEYVINVNFPNCEKEPKIKIAKLLQRNDTRWFEELLGSVIQNRKQDDSENYDKDSEIYLIDHECITISFLQKDFSNISLYNRFKDLSK